MEGFIPMTGAAKAFPQSLGWRVWARGVIDHEALVILGPWARALATAWARAGSGPG